MNSNFFVAFLVLVIAFDVKCSGKYVANNPQDLFSVRKLGKISATCESNQIVSECNKNVEYTIDGDSNTFWRSSSSVNGNEFQEVNLTFHFDQVNFEKKPSSYLWHYFFGVRSSIGILFKLNTWQ